MAAQEEKTTMGRLAKKTKTALAALEAAEDAHFCLAQDLCEHIKQRVLELLKAQNPPPPKSFLKLLIEWGGNLTVEEVTEDGTVVTFTFYADGAFVIETGYNNESLEVVAWLGCNGLIPKLRELCSMAEDTGVMRDKGDQIKVFVQKNTE